MVEVRVHSYRNPSGRCDECRVDGNPDPGCCDEPGVIRPIAMECPQSMTCDTAFGYCIRPSGETQECQLQQAVRSTRVTVDDNDRNFGDDFLGLPNPIEESDNEAWSVSLSLASLVGP